MDETTDQADVTLTGHLASLPRAARIAILAVFAVECAALGAGLLRERGPDVIRIDLAGARPAPGFSTL